MSSEPIQMHPQDVGHVEISDDEVVLRDFVERDPDVVEVVGQADDPDRAAHVCLQIGARAVKVTRASVDVGVVERAFATMTGEFDKELAQALDKISETADGLLAEDGTLTSALGDWQKEVDRMLGDTFDPDSKKSVITKIETLLDDAQKNHTTAIRRLIDPDDETSPLAAWRKEIVEAVDGRAEKLDKRLQEITERLAGDERAAEIFDLTTLKGGKFEDLVHAGICVFASQYGDAAEQVGDTKGIDGTEIGDEVITLNCDDTGGLTGRVVLEMKDRKLTYPKMMAELDAATSNRGAQVAIAVFASGAQAPTSVPFSYSDNRAILVYDKDDPDPHLMRLAYLWARWTVRKSLALAAGGEVDREKVHALIDRVVTALGYTRSIRGAHSSARKKIDEAGRHVDSLQEEINDALDELRNEIDG